MIFGTVLGFIGYIMIGIVVAAFVRALYYKDTAYSDVASESGLEGSGIIAVLGLIVIWPLIGAFGIVLLSGYVIMKVIVVHILNFYRYVYRKFEVKLFRKSKNVTQSEV